MKTTIEYSERIKGRKGYLEIKKNAYESQELKPMEQPYFCMYVGIHLVKGQKLPDLDKLDNITEGHGGITFSKLRTTEDLSPYSSQKKYRTAILGWDFNHLEDEFRGHTFESVKRELELIAQRLIDAGVIKEQPQ